MKHTWIAFGLSLALVVAPAAAYAVPSGLYAGGRFGMTQTHDYSIEGATAELDDSDTGWMGVVGYQFLPNLAIEGSYVDLGNASANVTSAGGYTNDLSASGFDVSAAASFPAEGQLGGDARIGALFWSQDSHTLYPSETFDDSESGTAMSASLGGHYRLQRALEIQAGYSRYFDVGDQDTPGRSHDRDMFWGGLLYRLGGK